MGLRALFCHAVAINQPTAPGLVRGRRGHRRPRSLALGSPYRNPRLVGNAGRRYRPGIGSVLNQIAFGASERAATMSGQPSPLKSANAKPYTVPLPSFQRTS